MTISPFALTFQLRNFADIVYAQTATLHTNVKKVKSQSTIPLMTESFTMQRAETVQLRASSRLVAIHRFHI